MKNILILGAGNAQIDLINYCKVNGYEVYGCSYTNTDKGIPLLDHFKQIDIKDVDAVTAYAKEISADLVYSVGSDLAIPTAMKVSENLNLPHYISYETAYVCQTKDALRSLLGKDFEGNIPFIKASTLTDAKTFTDFPCMMKPTDSQGQRGCYRIENQEEIELFFEKSKSHSKSGNVILEKYVNGPEVSVNVFLSHGKIEFFLVTGRKVFEEFPGGIIKKHVLAPNVVSKKAEQNIFNLVKNTLDKLAILNGPAYFQIKVEGVTPYLIEVTPRLDGCHMWNGIKHYCGADLLNATMQELSLGHHDPLTPKENTNCVLEFMCEKPGECFKRELYDVNDSEYLFWYYENGDTVKQLNGYMEKCGYQIYRGDVQ